MLKIMQAMHMLGPLGFCDHNVNTKPPMVHTKDRHIIQPTSKQKVKSIFLNLVSLFRSKHYSNARYEILNLELMSNELQEFKTKQYFN
jgi:hypothetical protein